MERGKKWQSNVKAIFSNAILSCYLLFIYIILGSNNNIKKQSPRGVLKEKVFL